MPRAECAWMERLFIDFAGLAFLGERKAGTAPNRNYRIVRFDDRFVLAPESAERCAVGKIDEFGGLEKYFGQG